MISSLLLASLLGSPTLAATIEIVHGTPVNPNQPISSAILKFPGPDGSTLCSGTLVSPHIAITAGHCVLGGFVKVGLEAISIANPGAECVSSTVMETTYMPGATPDGSLMNPDIALVHLSTTPCNTIPANLPDNRMLQTGDVVSAAGFGVGNGHADIPEQIHLRILPQTKDALVSLYQGEDRSWTNMIAQDFAKYSSRYLFALDADDYGSICNGDSGGPIFKESNGIVSLVGENGAYIVHPTKGIPACNGAYIQLFTPLAPYLGWIRSQIEIWGK